MKQWITMLLVTFLFTTASFASSSIAIVKQVQGDVTVKHNGEISRIIQGDELNEGDTLITGKNSYVGVIFHDGSILSLKENSFLQVKNFVFQPIEQTFNFKLLAEGVEDKETLDILKRMNCDFYQGYYAHKAMPMQDLGELLLSQKTS